MSWCPSPATSRYDAEKSSPDSKAEGQVGFAVIARRWVVERFLAWINRNRRLAKDFERTIASAEVLLYVAYACCFYDG